MNTVLTGSGSGSVTLPTTTVMSRLSCPGSPALVVMRQSSCSGSIFVVPAVLPFIPVLVTCLGPLSRPVFRIRIRFMQIRIQPKN
jgi:hypothetical protein